MYFEVAWILVSCRIQVQLQIILDQEYFPEDFSIFYEYDETNCYAGQVKS